MLERATGRLTNLTETLDRWVNSFTWSPDSARLFFTTNDRGRQSIQLIAVTGGAARQVVSGDSELDDMQLTRDGKTMIYTEQSGVAPTEIYRVASSGGAPVAADAPERRGAGRAPDDAARRILGEGAGRLARAEFRGEAVRVPGRAQDIRCCC